MVGHFKQFAELQLGKFPTKVVSADSRFAPSETKGGSRPQMIFPKQLTGKAAAAGRA